jgi:hypothetical protein
MGEGEGERLRTVGVTFTVVEASTLVGVLGQVLALPLSSSRLTVDVRRVLEAIRDRVEEAPGRES